MRSSVFSDIHSILLSVHLSLSSGYAIKVHYKAKIKQNMSVAQAAFNVMI